MTGMSISHISQLRHGIRNPSRQTLLKLSSALGVSMDSLAQEEHGPTKPADYVSDFDKEFQLLREECKKYGVDSVKTLRKMVPVMFKKRTK